MRSIAIAVVLSLAAFTARAETIFTATLDGATNVPPIPEVTSTGSASFTLNDAQTQLTYHIEYSGLSSPEIAAHIHVGGPRENGAPTLTLALGSPKDGVWNISPADVTNLFDGKLYVNVHTETYVSGEIRGNIVEGGVATEELSWGVLKALYH